jgi:acyl-CoA thioesterase II
VASPLVELLGLEQLELDIFRGLSPEGTLNRVFGGQVAAQALVAASRTVPGGAVHSMHAYFLRAGNPAIPILYRVERLRDGRSYTARAVEAIQRGRVIFQLTASFHDGSQEDGFDHQDVADGPVPAPETLKSFPALLADWGITHVAPIQMRYIDLRPVEFIDPLDPRPMLTDRRVWLKATGRLPDDPVLHACVVTYASDLHLLSAALLPHGVPSTDPGVTFASLDHAMWFHRPFRADEWLLHVQRSPSASDGRGLTTGSIHRQDGTLVVTVVQQGVVRRRHA